jgi:hypothetical protein
LAKPDQQRFAQIEPARFDEGMTARLLARPAKRRLHDYPAPCAIIVLDLETICQATA